MQNLALLGKGCSCSDHQGVYQVVAEEKSLCDLMVLNGWSLKIFRFKIGVRIGAIWDSAFSKRKK